MGKDSHHAFEVLVVGGGPAGIAASVRAADYGARVGLVDDNATSGGQIWRGASEGQHSQDATRWSGLLRAATLPNVMGAGGLQAMVKSGLPIRGKRVVVAGTGPLLLAVAAYLRRQGAEIPTICEQASWSTLARFGAGLLAYPGKIVQARQLKKELAGILFAANSWPVAAHGGQRLESVTISRSGRTEAVPCDYLACDFIWFPT